MIIFDDMVNISPSDNKPDDLIVLDGVQPKYIMNMYVHHILTGEFNIDLIEPMDIIQFTKLIDQYPLKDLTISILETNITNY